MTLSGTYDSYLVALSFIVASFASYTALDLGGRIRVSHGRARGAWLGTASVAMGGGIWSMHFIAMLAFLMPMSATYDVGLTVVSLLIAIGVTGVGFYVMGTRQATALQLLSSGVFMGIGIVAMHYTGMAAMHMAAELRYDRLLVALSVFVAIGASIAALWLAFRTAVIWQRILAALTMGFAISGMHYTGMAAASFTAHSTVDRAQDVASLAQTDLALAIAGVTFLILVLALVASVFDRKFAVLAERETVLVRESEERLRKLYRETPLPLHAVGVDGRIEEVSDTWLKLLGYTRDEVDAQKLTDFMTEDSRQRYDEIAWPNLRRGQEIREEEYQFVRKSGGLLDVLLNAQEELVDGRPTRILGGLIDVTARKRAEHALRHAQRMEAIGQLTGGVAHDFNNLLMVISGAAEKLRRTFSDQKAMGPLGMIATAVKRGQNLTGHLLSFARRQTLERTTFDLTKILSNLEEMLKRSLRGDIEIRTSAQDCPCQVYVDQGELELAVLNLGVNARDAMPDGGILSLSIRIAKLVGQSEFDGLRGEFVLMELTDTGVGIPPEVLSRVFDPFFTTKGVGKGTGLGLSQVYGFAKQSGGAATIRSKPGHGTTVGIYLPVAAASVQSVREMTALDREMTSVDDELRSHSGTVLLVEDSKEVAMISGEYFEQLGYVVDHASNGSDALGKLQNVRSYDLVFSDMLMPGSVAGLELARIVRAHHSEVPILLTTGYSEKAQEAIHEGFIVLQKPYDLQSLAKIVSELRAKSDDPSSVSKAPKR